jgi:hypothetical protein
MTSPDLCFRLPRDPTRWIIQIVLTDTPGIIGIHLRVIKKLMKVHLGPMPRLMEVHFRDTWSLMIAVPTMTVLLEVRHGP